MITALLKPEVVAYIRAHEHDDERSLLLKHKTIFNLPASIIANQIAGRRKAKAKIPLYYNTPGIIFSPGLNLEQSSSEETALFKASVLSEISSEKNSVVDLTGGFGIDSFFLSRTFKQVNYVEPNAELLEYARHNHQTLGAMHIVHHQTTAEDFFKSASHYNCVFIDPSRRTTANKKVFKLVDCEPDIANLLPEIFEHTHTVMIKTSPLLDIHQAISELQFVKYVWVVSVDNDCKELLFLCEKSFAGEPTIIAVNLGSVLETFTFSFPEEKNAVVRFSEPLTYLYEPNASLLKAGAFKSIANAFALFKIHPNTHLYTSENLVENFPGRIFKITHTIKPEAKAIAERIPEKKANVFTRNYPLSPDELKKKLKINDGGEQYVIGFTGENKKFVVIADRLK